jgi:hypothetical protein
MFRENAQGRSCKTDQVTQCGVLYCTVQYTSTSYSTYNTSCAGDWWETAEPDHPLICASQT